MPRLPLAVRTLESWLTLLTAVGLVAGGWACVLANVVHRFCRRATEPSWDLLFRSDRAVGKEKTRRDILRHELAVRLKVDEWVPEHLALGTWTAGGSLFGCTVGMILGGLHL